MLKLPDDSQNIIFKSDKISPIDMLLSQNYLCDTINSRLSFLIININLKFFIITLFTMFILPKNIEARTTSGKIVTLKDLDKDLVETKIEKNQNSFSVQTRLLSFMVEMIFELILKKNNNEKRIAESAIELEILKYNLFEKKIDYVFKTASLPAITILAGILMLRGGEIKKEGNKSKAQLITISEDIRQSMTLIMLSLIFSKIKIEKFNLTSTFFFNGKKQKYWKLFVFILVIAILFYYRSLILFFIKKKKDTVKNWILHNFYGDVLQTISAKDNIISILSKEVKLNETLYNEIKDAYNENLELLFECQQNQENLLELHAQQLILFSSLNEKSKES